MTAADAISDELCTQLRTVDNPSVRGEEGRVNIVTYENHPTHRICIHFCKT